MQRNQTTNRMISNEKMEEYWNRYRSEGVSKGLSMQAFCSLNNIPYNAFEKYIKLRRYFSTAHKITVTDIPRNEEITGAGSGGSTGLETVTRETDGQEIAETSGGERARILVSIRMTNGVSVRRKNLGYAELKRLVEKLEVLC